MSQNQALLVLSIALASVVAIVAIEQYRDCKQLGKSNCGTVGAGLNK